MTDWLLAIEIGGTKLQLVTARTGQDPVDITRLEVEPAQGAEGIRRQLADSVKELGKRFQWAAIGVGYGGPINRSNGSISRSFQIGGWSGFPLRDWLYDLVGVPVVVENDSNAAALGEAIFGSGVGFDPVFYTNSGSGVGGGLIIDGAIFHGAVPGEAEFGHLRLDRSGTIVEDICSGWAVNRRVRALADENPDSLIARLLGSQSGDEACCLPAALAERDGLAAQIIDETAESLAFALSHVVHLCHPQVIVLGGGLALIGDAWRDSVAEKLPSYLMDGFAPGPEVRLSQLGSLVVPMGMLHLMRDYSRK